MPVERKKTEAPTIAGDRAPAARAHSPAALPENARALLPVPETAWQSFVDPPTSVAPLCPPREAFDTAFGGLVFLLNAFLAMGLYPDFTRPLDPGLPVAPLALVDRLGGHWFGARYRRDPLHRWIARRGPQGALPRRWRVEADWLIPFANRQSWHDGSTLWHAAGFPIANRITLAQSQRLARRLDLPMLARAPKRTMPAASNPGWLYCLALFLAARFRRAAADGALTPETLAIPARAVIGEARIDVHIALAALPIALRLAGLDRDPGWLPAEGCDVRFHFE